MPNNSNFQTLAAENQGLRVQLEDAKASMREILSGEADAMFVAGAGGPQLFALKGTDQSYRMLIENMSEGALTLTPAGLILYANRRFAEMLRTPLEKVIGSGIHTWIAPESREILQTLLRKDAVENRREELVLAAADGTPVPVNLSVSHLILDEMPDSFCMVATDLTEQKRNDAILAADKLARAILDQAADAIVICDETGRIIRASKQAQAVYGRNPLGQTFEHAFPLRELNGTAFSPTGAIERNPGQLVEASLDRSGQRCDFLVSVGYLKGARNELLGSVITLTDITERKRGVEAPMRFASAMDTISDAIYLVDRSSMRFIHVNDAACRMQSATRAELLALGPDGVFSTSRAELERIYDTMIASGANPEPLELLRLRKNGSQAWVELRRHAQRSGDRWTIVTLVRDITERKEGERRVRESEKRFKTIFDQAPIAMALLDMQGHPIISNSHLSQMVGYSNDELLKMKFGDFTYPEDIDKDWHQFTKLTEGEISAYSMEKRFVHKSGNIIWANLFVTILRDENGVPQDIIGMAEDITERKRAERVLRESERRFSDLLGNVELVSVMCDSEGRITYCNEYLLHLTGWQYEEVIGQNWFEFFVPHEIVEQTKDLFDALLLNEQQAWHYDSEILTRSGERRLVRWNNSVLRSADGDVVGTASIGEDITQQKQAEIRIKRMNRVYAVLSGINTLIVRVHDRDELFREACRIAVDAGAFKMAWIGVIDHQTLDGKVVAWYGGEPGYVDKIRLTARDGTPDSERPACRALRLLQPVVCNDFAAEPAMAPLLDEMRRRGHKSVACFPLTTAGRPEAVFSLFAGEVDFFDEEEIKLLNELAGDIAFAIDHIDKEARLNYFAYYDVLTGLANRSLLRDRLSQAITFGERYHDPIWVVFLNIDRFTLVNNTLGHQAGELLLKSIAARLENAVRETDTLARIGGDEFMMVLPARNGEELEPAIVQRFMDALEQPFSSNGHELLLTCHVGVAIYPIDGADAETLITHAGIAMHRAKEIGANNFQFYTREMNQQAVERLRIVSDMRAAIEREEFVLHFQPQIDLRTGRIVGMEALIRWNHPELGMVPPVRFIGLAEESGLIIPIGAWAIRTACRQNKAWQDAGLGDLRIAVNLSARQFAQQGLVQSIATVLQETGLEARYLEIELTESLVMNDVEQAIQILRDFKTLGVQLSIDDFGTGYSSLAYLKRLPIDTLKIDRSFVRDVTVDASDAAIAKAIVSMAHTMGLTVIAEGVETEAQCAFLRDHMCDEIQGFFFSKPLAANDIEVVLQEDRRLPARLLRFQKSPRTLLLVDDEANILSTLKRLLRPDNYRIITAASGQEGLDILSQNECAVDVIVSDQRMPGMTGVEFLRKAKDRYPDTIRIVLSGYTELQSVTDAINEGAIYKFLTKPWDDAQLRAHIAEAFRQKHLADENRRLNLEVQSTNQQLAASNRQLSEALKQKQQQVVTLTRCEAKP